MDSSVFDKRIVKRNITNGLISKDQYDKFMDGLKDLTSQAEPVRERLFGEVEEEEEEAEDEDEDEVPTPEADA